MVRFTVRRWATAAVVAGALAGLDAGVSSISGVGLLVGKAEAVLGRPGYAGKCRRAARRTVTPGLVRPVLG